MFTRIYLLISEREVCQSHTNAHICTHDHTRTHTHLLISEGEVFVLGGLRHHGSLLLLGLGLGNRRVLVSLRSAAKQGSG